MYLKYFPILALIFLSSCSIQSRQFLNLDFEYNVHGKQIPMIWMTGGKGYDVSTDTIEHISGKKSVRINYLTNREFGVITSYFPIVQAKGKRCKFTGYIKTENVTEGYAGLWWRVDGPGGKVLAFDNMHDRGVKGTTDWTKYEIELPCDSSAVNINFGGLLAGNGIAWFDNFEIEIEGVKFQDAQPMFNEPSEKELSWIKSNAIPIKTVSAESGFDDLMPLKKLIGNARIVGLGEATHGTSEIFKMKHRIIEFLASEMGFNVFAIEANMPEAYKINDYVLYGKGDPKKLLGGLYFWTWDTQEVLDMIEWMRKFNQSGKGRIMFTGFDLQFIDTAAAIVRDFFQKNDTSYLKDFDKDIVVLESMARYDVKMKKTDEENKQTVDMANGILNRLEKNKSKYLRNVSSDNFEWVVQNARIILQQSDNKKSRDESMADNVEWILKHSPAGSKVVLWAHNFHISKGTPNSMGYYLSEKFAKDYLPIGFAIGSGTYTAFSNDGGWVHELEEPYPGCVEYYFRKAQLPFFALDLRNISSGEDGSKFLTQPLMFRNIGAVATENQFQIDIIPHFFDVMIYIDRTQHTDMFWINK